MSAFDEYVASFDGEPGYLNWAAFGPISPSVRAESVWALEQLSRTEPAAHAPVFDRAPRAADAVAGLLGAAADEVVLQVSSTHGLAQALYGLTGTVIASTAEFPSVSLTVERAAQASQGALTPRWITPAGGFVTTDAVAEALSDEVTAVAVSHVDFRTGFRADLDALRELIGPDRLLIVDAVQSFGVVDVDWSAADVVAGHGYKWLRAGRGTGFARYSERARARIRPVLSGIAGTTSNGLFLDELPSPAASARAFTVSQPDHLAAVRLAAGAEEIRDAGVAAIETRIAEHLDRIIALADEHGIPVASPRKRERRAGIVSLAPDDADGLSAALTDAGVAATARGGAVRVAAHAGTDAATIDMFGEALAAF
ncbi:MULTISPECIES: aminotransferase class V-fold PLP-dependent enzyme [unclassified Microbacterium]|uniref:aminotransferase class V-fold PLP-dependent enzyme n=1 Tax=unclassified Microbacterium TaxID=2609290 RepID=UPI0012FA725D|nr:aminotransferase class V-fold PLP-dependent enzyme [Microbacterium sp. MAH-37]MVQ41984.1 aminotransferase class V-fold PLP-dependent enzyme [Microbacterium sp. MAH-37]